MKIRTIENKIDNPKDFFKKFIIENHLSFVAEGECFSVYSKKDSTKIIKIQKTNGSFEKIKEVKYWIDFCITKQSSPFIQKLDFINIYKFNNRTVYVIETEELDPLPVDIVNDLNNLLKPYIGKDIKQINNYNIENLINKLKETNKIKNYIDNDFFKLLKELIDYIKTVSIKQGDTSFNFDLHYKNIMINPVTNKFVIIDFFNCSTYELE